MIDFDRFQSTGIGNTNPPNLANLAEREESRSSLCLSNVEQSKNIDKRKSQFTLLFNYFAGLDFSRIQSKLWLVLVPPKKQDLSSLPPRETLGTTCRLV